MRSTSLLLVALVAAACVAPVAAHVRLLYQPAGFPIRNALASTADGQYSVSGPCGGIGTYGKYARPSIASGSTISIKIGYNGGHQDKDNAFHAAMHCAPAIEEGSNFDDSVLKIGKASGAFRPLATGGTTVPATDSSTKGYTLTFDVLPNTGNAPLDCVIAAMDQRNWGGCIDVKLLPAAAPTPEPSGQQASDCSDYCSDMSSYCPDTLFPYANPDACLQACANMTRVAAGTTTGDNFECRRARLDSLVSRSVSASSTECAKAGPASTTCKNAGTPSNPSPCAQYCSAVTSNCGGRHFFDSDAACMQSCAGLADTSVGSTLSPPVGDNVRCRLSAASSGSCDAANPTASGDCKAANPLIVLNDTLSATYATLPSMCETRVDAAANTIAGCCCISGNITLIHVKGSKLATVSTALSVQGGEMCSAGINIAVPQYNFSTATPVLTNTYQYFNFSDAVTVSNVQDVLLRQPDDAPTSSTLEGDLTLGGDRFHLQLLIDDSGEPQLMVTNNVPSDLKPRVCSVAATQAQRIDSSGMQPPDDPSGDISAARRHSAVGVEALAGLVVAAVAVVMMA